MDMRAHGTCQGHVHACDQMMYLVPSIIQSPFSVSSISLYGFQKARDAIFFAHLNTNSSPQFAPSPSTCADMATGWSRTLAVGMWKKRVRGAVRGRVQRDQQGQLGSAVCVPTMYDMCSEVAKFVF